MRLSIHSALALCLSTTALGGELSTPGSASVARATLGIAHATCRARGRPGVPLSATPAAASSGAFVISPTFDPALTPAEVLVIYHAIGDWQGLIFGGAGYVVDLYPIHFGKAALPSGQVGDTDTTWDPYSGVLLSSTVTFDANTSFFVDPSPWEDTEYTAGLCTSGACAGYDLLTVARHHVGHALGWTGHFAPELNPGLINYMPANNGTLFDPSRWRVPLDPALTSHVDTSVWPEDLMVPALPTSERRGISLYPDLTVIARGFNFIDVAMQYVGASAGYGSSWHPHFNFVEANENATSGIPLLVASQDYPFSEGLVLDTPHVYTVVHAGTAVLK
jgi:hypothetical protein